MIKQIIVLALLVESVYLSEGLQGLMPFLNLEAVALVFGGTFLLSWASYPLREFLRPSAPEPLLYAGRCAVGMGVLTTLLSLMLLLCFPICDEREVYTRLSFSMAGLFYGFLLAKVVLAPAAARLARER